MPIIGQVGRRSLKVRVLNVSIHLVLLIGAVTMIYPFMLMVSSSFNSRLDSDQFSLWPAYFYSDSVLFKKYVEARYNEETAQFMNAWHFRLPSFKDVELPEANYRNETRYADWSAFLDEYADTHDIFDYQISEQYAFGVSPRNERAFRNMLKEMSGDNLEKLNEMFNASVLDWEQIRIEEKDIMNRRFTGDYEDLQREYLDLRKQLPRWHRTYMSLDSFLAANQLRPAYKSSLEVINEELGTQYANWEDVVMTRTVPEGPPLRKFWVDAVTKNLNIHLLRIDPAATQVYRDFLRNAYRGDIKSLNVAYGTDYTSFEAIDLPETLPRSGSLMADLTTFVEFAGRREAYQRAYREFLEKTYKTIDKLNAAYAAQYKSFAVVPMPETDMPASGARRDDYVAFVKCCGPTDMVEEAWQGYLKGVYGKAAELNRKWGTGHEVIEKIRLPLIHTGMVDDLRRFLQQDNAGGTRPERTARWREFLKAEYEEVKSLNEAWGTKFAGFDRVELPEAPAAALDDLAAFFATAPVPPSLGYSPAPELLAVASVEFQYRDWLKEKYRGDLDALNEAHGKGFASIDEVPLGKERPGHNVIWQQKWADFVKNRASVSSIGLKVGRAQQSFQDYIVRTYPELLVPLKPGQPELDPKTQKPTPRLIDVEKYNNRFGTGYGKAVNIYPPASAPENKALYDTWLTYVRTHAPSQFLEVTVADEADAWTAYLKDTYDGDVKQLNLAWGQVYRSFDTVPLDTWLIDANVFKAHKGDIRWEFIKRNYLMVFDVMWYNGRAILNTVIYCAMSIGAALLINPIAAYALSRFKLPTTYKIILVLMLTMAFPPMVMGIPNFLMLKHLNMLNTFWALVLPAAANGYFIFLLKGFFDSLPQELFECATLDGASEPFIFWNVAMALSKPIMAVVALQAFNVAYRNFMLAFIVCQDKSMWTMMVHIYQLGQRSSMGVKFAALVIAAIPTFVVFVFCQKIIIRGIVVPTEK